MSLASATTMAVSLMVMAVLLIVAMNLDNVATAVENQVEVRAYLADGTQKDAALAIRDKAAAIPGVAKVTYVSKEDALAQLKAQFGDKQGLLEGVEEEGALRDSLAIQATKPELVEGLVAQVRKLPGVSEVVFKKELVSKIFRATSLLRLAGAALAITLGVAMMLIISNTIRLTIIARGAEIGVMKMVGATDSFVRRPFIVEGMVLGFIGSVAAVGLVAAAYSRLVGSLLQAMPYLPILPAMPLLASVGTLVVALGVLIGAAGSLISIHRFLKV